MRRKTKKIHIGNLEVGGDAPVSVQSMTSTLTKDVKSTVKQIKRLTDAGCELIRVGVPDMDSAVVLGEIKKKIKIPLVADIHFDHRLALEAINQGVDGLRINPGNIGNVYRVKKVADAAKLKKIPIRVGVNAGSLEKSILEKYRHPTADALVESALKNVKLLEDLDFDLIKISVKASNVLTCIEAYRKLAKKTEYPLHIGITEAGTFFNASVKSAAGLGILLNEGIGDTLRVSITGNPVTEVECGWAILKALKLRQRGVEVISCPTCARAEMNVEAMAKQVEKHFKDMKKTLTIAVMGCVVNGPGEAKEADIGIAGGKGYGLLFKKGEISGKYKNIELVDILIKNAEKMLGAK